MRLLLFGIGLITFVFGLLYMYFPQMVLRFNAYVRAHFFKDSSVLLGHRRIGSTLLLVSFLFMALTLISHR